MRVMTVYGTRPEAIKVAPIITAIETAPDLESTVVVTGQHREMLYQVNTLFGIVPDHDMNIMSAGQSLNGIVARVIGGIDSIYQSEQPDVVIVQGDTSTVMGASLAAFNRQIPVVHLEAGLRSGDIHSPFPEEANRQVTSRVATLHLAPTEASRRNLMAENVDPQQIVVTGNSVIDSLITVSRSEAVQFEDPRLEDLQSERERDSERRILLVTAHRRENLGEAMKSIGGAVADLARSRPNLTVIFPLHKNPRVREVIRPALADLANVFLIEPLSYAEFAHALRLADLVLTDSGGVQEEAPSLGKPVLVMRENTERPEAVVAGTVKLIGSGRQRIFDEVSTLLDSAEAYASMANAVNPYGDGRTAERTLAALRWRFGGGERPEDFDPDAGNGSMMSGERNGGAFRLHGDHAR